MYTLFRLMVGSFILIGLLVIGLSARKVWWDYASAKWPQTTGQVISASLETVEGGSDEAGQSYRPAVWYRYHVNGQEFVGKRVSFSVNANSWSKNVANGYLEKYPVGKDVTVRYQADQPSLCVLESGVTPRSFMGVGIGLFFVVGAMGFLLVLRRAAQRAMAGADGFSGGLPPTGAGRV